jgi:hypothetical protein
VNTNIDVNAGEMKAVKGVNTFNIAAAAEVPYNPII